MTHTYAGYGEVSINSQNCKEVYQEMQNARPGRHTRNPDDCRSLHTLYVFCFIFFRMSERQDPRPQPPREPESDACCGQGCAMCVWDKYELQMERYKEELEAWLKRNPESSEGLEKLKDRQ